MNLQVFAIAVLLTALGAPRIVYADPEWHRHDTQWCLVLDRSQMCLPEALDIYATGLRHADFQIRDPGVLANIFVSYVNLGDPDGYQNWAEWAGENVFVLEDTRTVGELTVSRYSVNPAMADLSINTYVLEARGTFALSINNIDESYISELAQDLAEEWSSQSQPKPNLTLCGEYVVSGSEVNCPSRIEPPESEPD